MASASGGVHRFTSACSEFCIKGAYELMDGAPSAFVVSECGSEVGSKRSDAARLSSLNSSDNE